MPASPIPIAIVLTSFDRGGTERQMTELVRRLDPDRFAVHVVCFRREGPWLARVEERTVSLTEFRLRSFASVATPRQLLALARWLRTRSIAVVHACDLYANIFALPAAAIARVPVRIGSRRGIVSPASTRGLLPLQRLAYRTAHRIVANSQAAADCLAAEGVPPQQVAIIANGIEMNPEPAAPRPGTQVVTTVANLRAGKGHDVLLRAAAAVIAAHPGARFALVGDGPLRPALEAQARDLGVAGHVEFLGHRDDVDEILRASDVFAFPSLMEAFPNGVMEAMAAGLGVVASRVGGIPELVEHEHSGLLVPPGDAAALAASIIALLDHPQRARALGAGARRTIEERYSFDRMVAAFEALYLDELRLRATGRTVAAALRASR